MNKIDYMEKVLCKYIDKVQFKNWEFYQEFSSGTFVFYHKKSLLSVFATPFWEGSKGIEVEIGIEGSDEGMMYLKTLPFYITYSNEQDFNRYVKIMSEIIQHLNLILNYKRS